MNNNVEIIIFEGKVPTHKLVVTNALMGEVREVLQSYSEYDFRLKLTSLAPPLYVVGGLNELKELLGGVNNV